MNELKLGKKPHKKDERDFKLAKYTTTLPPVPITFGHDTLVKNQTWGMLGNDEYGDCVWAGAAHEFMLWKSEAGQTLRFTSASVLSDYSAVTGFDPNDPSTDQGTDVREAMKYRQSVGILDANGKRHRTLAYLSLEPGNMTQLWQAVYLFGAVGIGFNVPNTIWDQWDAGQKWTVVDPYAPIEGGHYVPIVARRDGLKFITWGRETSMSKDFYQKYCDEAWVMLSGAPMTPLSPEGFNMTQLKADLAAL